MSEWLERLKARADVLREAGVTFSVEDRPFEVTQADLARERRLLRMKAAGQLFPAAMESAMAHVGRCPRTGDAWQNSMADVAEAFVRDLGVYSLVMSAPPGRGKSWVATWVVAESRERSLWVPAAECRVGDVWGKLRERALKCDLLVVDDLGEEASGDWGVREMATLLESRHNAGKRTVVTTNLLPEDLGRRYGERLLSRWSQAAYSRLVVVRGADLRRGR